MTKRRVLWWAWPLVVGVVFLGRQSESAAQDGCQDLDSNTTYEQLTGTGAEHARAGRHDDALEAFRQAQAICPFDPTVTFYIARTRQLQGKCETAVELYLQARSQLTAGTVPTPAALGDAIDEKLAETRATCDVTTIQRVTCADDGVRLSVDGGAALDCPAELELAPGHYTLAATRPGAQPFEVELEIEAGRNGEVRVPALADAPGRLRVSCPPELDEVVVAGPGGDVRSVACGEQVTLAPGPWSVRVPDSEVRRDVEIVAGESTTVALTELPGDEVDEGMGGMGIGGLVSIGVGVALVGGGVALHFVAEDKVAGIDETMTRVEALDVQDEGETLNTVGIALMGVGGAALATGVVLVVLDAVDVDTGPVMAAASADGERAWFVLGTRF